MQKTQEISSVFVQKVICNFFLTMILYRRSKTMTALYGPIIHLIFQGGDIFYMASFYRKYKHGLLIAIYSVIYVVLFHLLEMREVRGYHVIYSELDNLIPFCEYFIVPYLLWFPYLLLSVLWFIFFNPDKKEYYRLTFNLILGMTIFLVVSWLYPNIQHLRPEILPRENIFADAVRALYATDTPTNILPSIHVFNSLAIHMSLTNCAAMRNHRGIRRGSLILTILIILSTMFLKQHSVIDVCLGSTMALFGYLLFYPGQARELSQRLAEMRRQSY